MEASFSSYLNFAILVQCFFSIIYLAAYQWRRNRWLVLVFVSVFLIQLGLFTKEGSLTFGQRFFIGNPGMLLFIPPSIYLFTKELVSVKIKRQRMLFHFLPGLIFYVLFLFTEVSRPEQFILLFSKGEFLPLHLVHFITIFLVAVFYGYATLKLIRFNQKKYQNEYADTSIYLTLDWLKYVAWVVLLTIMVGVLLVLFSSAIADISFSFGGIELAFLITVMTVSYFAFRQPTLYQDEENEATLNLGETAKVTPAKPLLSEDAIAQLSERLDTYFSKKKPFLQSDIRMPEIAKALDVSPNEFSWYLNEHLQSKFFTFINEYRVRHAAVLLKEADHQHYTLEGISKMSGFRSKTTFNNRFKEIMGMTPSMYRKRP